MIIVPAVMTKIIEEFKFDDYKLQLAKDGWMFLVKCSLERVKSQKVRDVRAHS